MAKLINSSIIKKGELGVDTQVVRYVQNTDTWDMNIDEYQYLELKTVGVDGLNEEDNTDSFIRISIGSNDHDEESGISNFWSIDGPEELIEIFNDFARRTGMSCRWEIKKYHVELKEERKDEKNENR